MSDEPYFDIDNFALKVFEDNNYALSMPYIEELLVKVWNARGAADLQACDLAISAEFDRTDDEIDLFALVSAVKALDR